MDEERTKALQERTDAKLRYARVNLDELKEQGPLSGNDFDKAHQESFLFHLFGARDALLQELNHYYGANLSPEELTSGKLRAALEGQGLKSEELKALHELEQDEESWYRQTKDMRDYTGAARGPTASPGS